MGDPALDQGLTVPELVLAYLGMASWPGVYFYTHHHKLAQFMQSVTDVRKAKKAQNNGEDAGK